MIASTPVIVDDPQAPVRVDLYAAEHGNERADTSGSGWGVIIGGGVTNFTNSTVRADVQLGEAWDARLVFGTRSWLGAEAGYNGSVNDISALGLSGHTKLLGTGARLLARLNLTTDDVQPYVVAGAGWKHYALAGDKYNVSGVRNDDNVVELPMGGGLAYHSGGFMLDVRAMYNYTVLTSLFTPTGQSGSAGVQLHCWSAQLNLGFEL